jgi:hypothetical protein
MANLFYDQDIHQKVEVRTDTTNFVMTFQGGSFKVEEWIIETKLDRNKTDKRKKIFNWESVYGFDGFPEVWEERSPSTEFKYYKFAKVDVFTPSNVSFLEPPDGRNLLTILQTNSALRRVVNDIFSDYGFKIVFKPLDNKIEVLKGIAQDIIISYPYTLVSDTLQRVVFYLAAIETNKDSVIIFEEPEAHAFPYYTKFLAERIAIDKINQYFISTHNPYFLLSILEKTPKDDIGIFIIYFEDYQTKVKHLTEKEMSEVLDLDTNVFFNLDRFINLR